MLIRHAGIVFRSWRITGFGSLIVSLLAIVALSAGYEAIKEAARQYEARSAPPAAKDTRECHAVPCDPCRYCHTSWQAI